MKRKLGILAYFLFSGLGLWVFASGFFEPSFGWTILSIVPAAAGTWFVTKLAAADSNVPKRRRTALPIVVTALLFIGPYMFTNWAFGTMLTSLLGESYSRPAVVRFADRDYRTSRRGKCQRVGATIKTPRGGIDVSQCMSRTYVTLPEPGTTVYYLTRESPFGSVIKPTVFAPP